MVTKAMAAALAMALFGNAESISWQRDFAQAARRAKVSGKVRVVVFAVDKSGRAC